MKLRGKDYSRRELESLTGDLRQAMVRTGGGLDFPVLLDRGMDLGHATFKGIPLTWHSPIGSAHSHRAEPDGFGWLRTFPGGLLSTCGLTNVGPPGKDVVTGEALGLHGRISSSQARNIAVESVWDGDDWALTLKGTVEEAAIFRHRLTLERTIRIVPGVPGFLLTDRIRNFGGAPAPLMLLYHCNLGWPLLSPDTTIISPATMVTRRGDEASLGRDQWGEFPAPVAGFQEQVFFHHLPTNRPVVTRVENKPLGIAVEFSFHSGELDHLTQWKQAGFGDYVMGIEPGNCHPLGQEEAKKQSSLPWLQPGETKEFSLGFRCLSLS